MNDMKWIPVTERLPEENISVLVCLSSKVNAVARIMAGGWKLAWNHKPIAVVTHWMPLPEPPKEVE